MTMHIFLNNKALGNISYYLSEDLYNLYRLLSNSHSLINLLITITPKTLETSLFLQNTYANAATNMISHGNHPMNVSFALGVCSDSGSTAGRSTSDPGLHGTSLSPQSVSSGGDSGVDTYCDHMSDFPSITVSLCGGLSDNREITKGRYHF